MKHHLNRALSVVALLMMTIGTWARGGQVTINVLPNANAGTVTSAISDGVCTLTVTPASGYYMTVDNLKAVATLNGGAVQAPNRAIPVQDGILDITATKADADPTGVTTYTFDIEDAYDVVVTANFQTNPKPLSVCGVVVTEQNCHNVLGDNMATVSYDYTTNTLTLNNATLDPEGTDWAVVVGFDLSVLNVRILGTNSVKCNAFKFLNCQPSLLFTTDPIVPGSLTVGPFADASAPYSLILPEIGDNASSVFYNNNLKLTSSTENITVSGDEPIILNIGDVQVTGQNMADVLGDNTVSFDAATKTLTLNGATIDTPKDGGNPIQSNIQNLRVCLIGENTLATANNAGFLFTNASSVGTVTFVHADNGYGRLTVTGGGEIAQGYNVAYDTQESGWTVAEGAVSYLKTYELAIGNTAFTATNLTIASGNGSATFSPLNNTLSLNNFTTTDNLTSTLQTLTISLTGINSLGAISGTVVVGKDMNSEAVVNKLTATSVPDAVTIEEPLTKKTVGGKTVISDVVSYNLWVNGLQVDRENMTAVASGISFDGDHTLTLNNVTATVSEAPFIVNGLDKLTIHLLGTNTVTCGQFLTKKEADNDHQVSFSTSMKTAGELTVNVSDVSEWFTGHTTPTYLNGLTALSSEGTMTIKASPEDYHLTIGGVSVTNLNAANVLGDGKVSFDATMNTLTLDGATINGDIASSRETLNVFLKGNNTMSGGFTLGQGCNSAELNIASAGAATDKLTMGAAFASGISANYRNKLQLNNLEIALPNDYGISVAGITITPDNRDDVLSNNQSVKFDNNNQLILKNAVIEGEIVVEDASSLPNNTLVLYLLGDNTINLAEGQKPVNCLNGNLTLKFKLDDSLKGKLELNGPAGYITYENLFPSNITVDLASSLNVSAESSNTLSILADMQPIVNDDKTTVVVDFSKLPPSFGSQNVNGVQINASNENADKNNSGGVDHTTGQMVFTSADVVPIEDIYKLFGGSQVNAPASLQFTVPAGSTNITFHNVVLPSAPQLHVFHFTNGMWDCEVGAGSPTITVSCSEPQMGTLYLAEKDNPNPGAPQMVNRRIGPKSSVAGGLGGITIKSNYVQKSSGPSNDYKMVEKSALTAAISAVSDAQGGYCCNDPDITDLPDNMFLKMNTSNAPRRGSAVETILPEGLTFVDFSKTKITGMEISRTEGPFNGVPENVFIYMPAGNTTKEKNVVIGGICNNMELNGEVDAQPFKAMKDFVAGQATLKRDFTEAGTGESKVRATIYLPYAIPQEDANKLGTFYEYESNDGTTVSMTMVTKGGLKANKPYIFEAKEGGVKDPTVTAVNVLANPVDTEGFKGVFERKNYEDGMYCYAAEAGTNNAKGQFVEMGPGAYVPPFRAYIIGDGAPSYAIAWDGVVDDFQNEENATAVETVKTVKTVTSVKTQEGWWTISGMRLNAQPKKAGLYVKDGRLVVVK